MSGEPAVIGTRAVASIRKRALYLAFSPVPLASQATHKYYGSLGDLIDMDQWRGGTPQTLTAEQAIALVRHLAKEGNYRFTEHALDRMHERHVTAAQVIAGLKHGDLIAGPERTAQGTREKNQLSDIAAGERVTVTAVIDSEGIRQVVLVVIVVTVF